MELRFTYRALSPDGARKRGSLMAPSERDAFRILSERGLTPTHIASAGGRSRERIRPEDVAAFTRELNVLVEARIPLARGLTSIADHEDNQKMRDMIMDIARMIESGSKITEALTKYSDVFGELYIETMRAAEASGSLPEVTGHLADMLENRIQSARQLRRALSYPVIVVLFVAIALAVIVVFVVPRFAVIFESNGVQLPLTTRGIRWLGDTVAEAWWAFLGVGGTAVTAMVAYWRTPNGRRRIEGVLFSTPVVGRIMEASAAARFTRVLSICLGSGLDIIESIGLSGRSTGSVLFREDCQVMTERLRGGESMGEVIRSAKRLPSFASRMLGAGKNSQELTSACKVISRHYEREADQATKSVNALIEPILTMALAGIVLLVALSVFLPMWEMMRINQ